jgi:hypothetical protein
MRKEKAATCESAPIYPRQTPRLLWRSYNWLGCEIEGDAKNIRVLNVEEPVLVEVIRLTAKSATNDLFA